MRAVRAVQCEHQIQMWKLREPRSLLRRTVSTTTRPVRAFARTTAHKDLRNLPPRNAVSLSLPSPTTARACVVRAPRRPASTIGTMSATPSRAAPLDTSPTARADLGSVSEDASPEHDALQPPQATNGASPRALASLTRSSVALGSCSSVPPR